MAPWPDGAWRRELAAAISSPRELLEALGLPIELADRAAEESFPLRVPRGLLRRIRPGDASDPILRQLLPVGAETDVVSGFGADPVGEIAARSWQGVPGLMQKYPGRVLLVLTGACAVHCRYCFRRHFAYAQEHVGADLDRALEALAERSDIHEVILSGGDPLALPDRRLAELVSRLDEIASLERLRIHTRIPVMLPERITGALLGWLAGTRLRPVVVIHVNHAQELADPDVLTSLALLRRSGATLLNQSVLLRGVNDTVEAQVTLAESLFAAGVLPYYLHLLDPVAGAAHFDVPEVEGADLVAAVRERLPGYLVPRLVRETPGKLGKTAVAAAE